MIAQIQMRRGTTAEWAAASPVILLAGESGYDTTLKRYKVGDGETEWANLEWNTLWSRPIGSIYESTVSTSPASLFGGTWEAIDAGRFLVAAGTGYPAGDTGGSATVSLGLDSGYAKLASYTEANYHAKTVSTPDWEPNRLAYLHQASIASGGYDATSGLELGGSTASGSIIPPWYAVYMWVRTA